MVQVCARSLLDWPFNDYNNLEGTEVVSGDGELSPGTSNSAIGAQSLASGSCAIPFGIVARANQWYAFTLEVQITSNNLTQWNFAAASGFDFTGPIAGTITGPTGTYCIYMMRTTDGPLSADVGVGIDGLETAGNAGGIYERFMVQEVTDPTDPPKPFSPASTLTAYLNDNSSTSVNPTTGLVTFGGDPTDAPPIVLAVKTDSFGDQPSVPEWTWYLNNTRDYPVYTDAVSQRTLVEGNTVLAISGTIQSFSNLASAFNVADPFESVGNTNADPSVAHKPNILVCGLAVNDVIQEASPEAVLSRAETFRTNARSLDPGIILIYINIAPWRDTPAWDANKQIATDLYNAGLVDIVDADPNTYLIDAYTLLAEPGNPEYINPIYTDDGFHPNALGSQVLGDAVDDLIQSLFVPLPGKPLSQVVVSGGALTIDGNSIVTPNVLYVSPNGGLTANPNGEPLGNVTASGDDLIVNGTALSSPNSLFVSPNGILTTQPNGRAVANFLTN